MSQCYVCGGTGRLGDPRCDAGDHDWRVAARAKGEPDMPGDEEIGVPQLREVVGTGGSWKRMYACKRDFCPQTTFDLPSNKES